MPEETLAPKPLSELDRLFGALFDPKPAFADIAARPRPWIPLALLILAVLGYTYTIGQHVGWERVLRQQAETNQRFQQIPPERQEEIIEQQARFVGAFAYVQAFLALPLLALVVAGVFLFVFNLLLGADIRFKQAYAVVVYGLLPLLLSTVLSIVVVLLKEPRDVNIQNPVASNLGAFLDPNSVPAWLVSVGNSVDLFSIASLLLLATGFSAAARKLPWSKAFRWVVLTWVFWLVVKGGGAWVFS